MDPNKVGNFIRKLRKDNNLTQEAFAELFNVTYQAVSKWENGVSTPNVLTLKEISKKFNVDIDELLDGQTKAKKLNKKLLLILIIILVLSISIVTTLVIKNKNSSNFEFKTLSSDCSNFKITGSIAYNSKKSHIYISNIEYCGGNDTTEYETIECVLYENNANIDKKIDTYVSTSKIKLEEFLKDVKFHIDDYSAGCKEFIDSKVFLQINATAKDNNITSYKIPLNYEESCYVN